MNKTIEFEPGVPQKDHVQLDAKGIERHLVGKTFFASFPPSFKYIVSINKDGSLEGKNDHDHYDTGTWVMDAENNTLSVSWDLGWGSSTSHVYLVNNIVKIFDSTSGKLNTSFDEQIDDVESIKTFEF